MSDSDFDRLAGALEKIAAAIEANPAPIIGQKICVTNVAGGGPVIGMKVSVTNAGGGSGPVYGNYVSVTNAGGRSDDEMQMIKELRNAASAVRGGGAPKSWVTGLLSRAGGFVGKALSAATVAGAEELAKHALT
ncbi:hypothetical protein [Sphingomonas abietis]|uniref:HK97 gp10 family phage protein n=1 Tax=Sphingomonas abietis TaxID=3012344 RepID=A0ABY7NQP5_9SPHN|nr:hypothetical protein [Sphingomonas abietis]WBO23843.1 hypothetical protein PBT88_06900 [Sphingomonas abietis]